MTLRTQLEDQPLKKKLPDASTKMTRRDLLKRAGGAGLTLAAAQALSPFLLSGCGGNGGGGGGRAGGGTNSASPQILKAG